MKENEAKIEAYSVRIAELMKAHEHGVLTTTKDKLLVDFVTKTTHPCRFRISQERAPQYLRGCAQGFGEPKSQGFC